MDERPVGSSFSGANERLIVAWTRVATMGILKSDFLPKIIENNKAILSFLATGDQICFNTVFGQQ